MNSESKIAVVLLNWNNTEDTLACIGSLRNLTYKSFQIVIVDNGSKPSEYTALKAGRTDEVILRQQRNLGFAGGCNVGIRWALQKGFEYVWLLNNDTEVGPESLGELVQSIESDPNIGIAGGVLYYWSDPQRIQIAGGLIDPVTGKGGALGQDELDNSQFRGVLDVDYVSGGILLARCEAIKQVGLLDERFFIYYEDTDWAVRMRKSGRRVVTVSSAKAWHKDKASTGSTKPYLIQHGYFMFLYKNFRRNLLHAMRIYLRHYVRPHLQRGEFKLAWADAKVYWKLVSRLAFVRANINI